MLLPRTYYHNYMYVSINIIIIIIIVIISIIAIIVIIIIMILRTLVDFSACNRSAEADRGHTARPHPQ